MEIFQQPSLRLESLNLSLQTVEAESPYPYMIRFLSSRILSTSNQLLSLKILESSLLFIPSTNPSRFLTDCSGAVVGGRPHGHAYGLGSAINSKVQRVSNSTQSQQVHQPPGYLDTETVQNLIQEKLAELEQHHKEREEEQKREFEEREARRNKEFNRDMQRAIRESQMMFIQAISNRNMDGASSSRPLRADKAPIEEEHRRNMHHQSNWYESDYDVSNNEDEDEIIYQTDEE